MKTGLWYGWWWFILLALWSLTFHIVIQYPLFHHPSQFVLLQLSRDSHTEIWSRRFLLLMWNPDIKVINITKLVQLIFNARFGYFEYISYLLHHVNCCSQCLNCIAINFNWSTSGTSSSKKSLVRNFTNPFRHVQSVTGPSPYAAQIFFCISVAFLPFLK